MDSPCAVYKEVIEQFAQAYGIEKSATSEHFIHASRNKLEQLLKRSLEHLSLTAILIDGTIFKGQHLIVAVGLDRFGTKVVLGLRQGASENATVVEGLLGELAERGINFQQPRLYLVDGSKAIRRGILTYAGDAAFIQRCQVHKIRNVTEHLPEAKRPAVKYRMRAAYLQTEASDAKQALYRLHDELMTDNSSAAASLAEKMEETLTVSELRLTPRLRQALSSTNAIESSFSVVERICSQAKRCVERIDSTRRGGFRAAIEAFLPVKVLGAKFRGLFLALLRRAFRRKELRLAGKSATLQD